MRDNLVEMQNIIIDELKQDNPYTMNSPSNLKYLKITYKLLITKNNIALHTTKTVT